ncbi:hypothetical protein SAMN05444365_103123 [Micromonospora pattaloongensis]|uniref:Uncharacterized protein n=1 Tax=Micromonospora pattaloongensis TaxID=405436 RepID=A0A1H3LW96_9ACTN|nr:hypothetical protein SAMN05444365_103123 [Micromonospora pattaloongensis]
MRLANPAKVDQIAVSEELSIPVFVDVTGRRQRLVRWLAIGVTGGCLGYAALLVATVAGSPVIPPLARSLPQLESRPQPAPSVTPTPDSARRARLVAAPQGGLPAPAPTSPPAAVPGPVRPQPVPVVPQRPPGHGPGLPPVTVPPIPTRPPRPGTPTPEPTRTAIPESTRPPVGSGPQQPAPREAPGEASAGPVR